MGRSSLWIVGLSLCVVLHALGTDALAADAKLEGDIYPVISSRPDEFFVPKEFLDD